MVASLLIYTIVFGLNAMELDRGYLCLRPTQGPNVSVRHYLAETAITNGTRSDGVGAYR